MGTRDIRLKISTSIKPIRRNLKKRQDPCFKLFKDCTVIRPLYVMMKQWVNIGVLHSEKHIYLQITERSQQLIRYKQGVNKSLIIQWNQATKEVWPQVVSKVTLNCLMKHHGQLNRTCVLIKEEQSILWDSIKLNHSIEMLKGMHMEGWRGEMKGVTTLCMILWMVLNHFVTGKDHLNNHSHQNHQLKLITTFKLKYGKDETYNWTRDKINKK